MARILVVDDDELALFTLGEILKTAGHIVVEARNGNECLEFQRNEPFDLVVTDIIMPEKDGIETVIELRKDFPEIKIIAISGGGRTHDLNILKVAEEFGADSVLAKPFSGEQLLASIEEQLGQ